MSPFIYLCGIFYALASLGAVTPPPTPQPSGTPPPATGASTNVSTVTATATATNPAVAPAPAAPVTAEIFFNEGSSALNSSAIQNLQIALRSARLRGQIAEAQVLGWSDSSIPAGQVATAAQISLADQRSQAVAGFLRAANPAVPVKTINVAQRPTALQTLLTSPELGARTALGSVGIINPDTSTKRAEAVVVLILR